MFKAQTLKNMYLNFGYRRDGVFVKTRRFIFQVETDALQAPYSRLSLTHPKA